MLYLDLWPEHGELSFEHFEALAGVPGSALFDVPVRSPRAAALCSENSFHCLISGYFYSLSAPDSLWGHSLCVPVLIRRIL